MKHLIVISLTILGLSVGTNGLMKFYDSVSFEGLFHETTSAYNCTNLPVFGQSKASSLKTDQCFFAHTGAGCTAASIKFPAGDYPDLQEVRRGTLTFNNAIKSFSSCTDSKGGPKLNVALRTNNGENATTMASYSDVCSCIDLPLFAIGKVNSLTNGGNCVKLYSELECTGSSVEIPGGIGADTEDLTTIGFNGVTKSISRCGATTTCERIEASVTQITLSADPAQFPEPSLIEMPFNVSYSNDGEATVIENYNAAKQVNQVVEIFRDSDLVSLNKVSVSSSVSTEINIDHEFFVEENIGDILNDAFTLTQNANERFISSKRSDFKVTENIQISPCSVYSIASFVKAYENFPADYQLTLEISGISGDKKMFAEDVKARLSGGLEYVRDKDEYTIIARVGGTLNASFGIEAIAQGQGQAIPQC